MDRKTASRFIQRQWRIANALYFGNRLPRIPLLTRDLSKECWLGSFDCDTIEIRIDHVACETYHEIYYTLIHEMIHHLQQLAKSERTKREHHGRFFQRHHIRIFGARYHVGFKGHPL